MKQTYIYIINFFMAALVFYGGAGVNIASFCCDDCRKAGMEVLTGDKCCDIHGHSHEEGVVMLETAQKNLSHTHEMCCNLMRLSFDWDHEKSSIPDMQPLSIDLLSLGTPDASLIPLPQANQITGVMPTGPPPVCPRTYLSKLTTLLI